MFTEYLAVVRGDLVLARLDSIRINLGAIVFNLDEVILDIVADGLDIVADGLVLGGRDFICSHNGQSHIQSKIHCQVQAACDGRVVDANEGVVRTQDGCGVVAHDFGDVGAPDRRRGRGRVGPSHSARIG